MARGSRDSATGVLAALRSLEPSLTEGERRIARAILQRPNEVVDWSGRELARRGETSETVLFKLAGKLGLSGFRELKVALLKDGVFQQARDEAGLFNVPLHPDAPLPVQIRSVVEAYAGNIQQTATLLANQRLAEVADALASAKLVSLLGMGASLSVATIAENVLGRLGLPCRLSLDSHQQLLSMTTRLEGHVVLAFSYSGETRETVEAFRQGHESGAFTVAVTAFAASPIAEIADSVLLVPVVNPHPYRVGLVDAVLPFLMILDVLALLIAPRRDVAGLQRQTESAISKRKLRSQRG